MVIAINDNGEISYHYCQSQEDENDLPGTIIGKYPSNEYLRNESGIQAFHKQQLKKEKP